MIVRRIDVDGDWTFGKGNSNYFKDEFAVQQSLRTRLMSWVGDCFFALSDGVDWRSRLDVGQRAALLEEVKSVILQTEGVISINKLNGVYDENTRALQLEYDVQTIFSNSFLGTILQSVGS